MARIETQLHRLADVTGLTPNVLVVMGAVLVALVVGSLLRLTHLRRVPPEKARGLLLRLRTWWIIAIILVALVFLGRGAVVVFMAIVSILALREYLRLVPHPGLDRRVIALAYLAIPVHYLWIYLGWYGAFLTFIPIWVFLVLTARLVLVGKPDGFVRGLGALDFGMMILVFCFSHVACLLALPAEENTPGGAFGWFLYLLVLTEGNDIAQAVWGRAFGRRPIMPEVSPAKTWEGFIGGVVTTTAMGVLLAPLLTPIGGQVPYVIPPGNTGPLASPVVWSTAIAALIAIAGFLGDVTMSAVKRDCHVKESGTLLPGQGGLLDRIDSLTFTAPVFFHLVHTLYH